MGMDSSSGQHHHQEMIGCSETLESMVCRKSQTSQQQSAGEKKAGAGRPRAGDMQALIIKCPRCDSTNTKFCYYNNYSLTQPRYFCKSCRRYWTKGGTLRNVPVGGGCRKNKLRSSSSSSSLSSPSSSSSFSKRLISQDHQPTNIPSGLIIPSLTTTPLTTNYSGQTVLGLLDDDNSFSIWGNPNMPHHHHHHHHHGGGDVLGSLGLNASSSSPSFDALIRSGGGFLDENPLFGGGNGIHHNLYHGMGNVNNLEMENIINGGMILGMSSSGTRQEMGRIPFEDFSGSSSAFTTTMKQEIRNGGRDQGDQGRVLWGFPWKNISGNENGNVDGNGAVAVLDSSSTRSMNWNGINGSSSSNWHGLLNSPLV